jgi:acyl transferase domain-containing protein
MTEEAISRDRIAQLSQKQLTLLALELQDRLAAERRKQSGPIAIVGMACRLPGGVDTPEAFWEMLIEGRDAITEVPPGRWDIDQYFDPDPDVPGKMSTRFGGFVSDIDAFDAELFGISRREAESMDPQQRMMLEVTWEALERAGIAPDSVRGTKAGIFAGICNNDYSQLVLSGNESMVDAYSASGSAFSVAAGRVAYTLGLEGASMVIDTACSSSLVALHEACQHLRSGSVSLALAGGVNVICTPATTIALSKAHMMAPDGRCKTFDNSADGFVRAEGCGVLVLKRLEDAVHDGDRVLALIRGSAVNQDGRSSGLTVPSGAAQERVIREALLSAGLSPVDVGFVEAHGTGTSLGDPIEVRALAAALCDGRTRERPLVVGSVKSNIGHLESAAGIAGVIKAVLSIQTGKIPSNLHLKDPNHDVDWDEMPIRLADETLSWPADDTNRIAGVSSFGFSGTNAHVLLSAPPLSPPSVPRQSPPQLHFLPLSARNLGALERVVAKWRVALDGGDLPALCHTARVGRAHQRERVAAVGSSGELIAQLEDTRLIRPKAGVRRAPGDAEVVFVFTGSGSQWPGMGACLYREVPVFRRVVDQCGEILSSTLDVPLASLLEPEAPAELLQRTRYQHPVLFALQFALSELWRSWGIEPAAVAGHSLGEYVAACVAGVYSLEDAISLVAERARLIDDLPSPGAMAAVLAPASAVDPLLAESGGQVEIAALNGPANTVISGPEQALGEAVAKLVERGMEVRRLGVDRAFHSAAMDPVLDSLQSFAAGLHSGAPKLPFVSNLTGEFFAQNALPDGSYWRRHARAPVQFARCAETLLAAGYRWFLELGPHPAVLPMIAEHAGDDALLLASLRRDTDAWQTMLTASASLYVNGADFDWASFGEPYGLRQTTAPTYPFVRERFWTSQRRFDRGAAAGASPTGHPLLGNRVDLPMPVFLGQIAAGSAAYLLDHRLHGRSMVSAPVFAELACAAAEQMEPGLPCALHDLSISHPLALSENEATAIATTAIVGSDGLEIAIYAKASNSDRWQQHASARCVRSTDAKPSLEPPAPAQLDASGYRAEAGSEHYRRLNLLGIDIGPSLAGIDTLWQGPEGDVVARMNLPSMDLANEQARIAVADTALQTLGACLVEQSSPGGSFMLSGIRLLRFHRTDSDALWCRARISECTADAAIGDVAVFDEYQQLVASLSGISLRRVSSVGSSRSLGYRVEWRRAEHGAVASQCGTAAQLAPVESVASAAGAAFERAAAEWKLADYEVALPAVDRLAARYIYDAFVALGANIAPGASADPLLERIDPSQRRLFPRLLEILEEDGALIRTGKLRQWAPGYVPASPDAADIAAEFPNVAAELAVLEHCGQSLAGVLQGDIDPVAVLFSDGLNASMRRLYRETPFAGTMNATLRGALEAALNAIPYARPVRLIEIGAGTGATTSAVLSALHGRRVEYVFTDVSPVFLDNAAAEFREDSRVSFRALNIERSPLDQGFEADSFDIVIAANVLHATRDLALSVGHAKALLSPGGYLMLLEGTMCEPWVDLTFGLTEGWWRFDDAELRDAYPLLDRSQWPKLLEKLGFQGVELIPGNADGSRYKSQALIMGRHSDPADDDRHVAIAGLPQLILGSTGEFVTALAREAGARVLPVQDLTPAAVADALAACGDASTVHVLVVAHDFGPDEADAGADLLRALQSLLRAGHGGIRVWICTCGAVGVDDNEAPTDLSGASLWGLARGYAAEHPDVWGGIVDADPAATDDERVWQVLGEIASQGSEDQIAYRSNRRRVARLVAAPLPGKRGSIFRRDSGYLISGGTGGLGLVVARWAAREGAGRIWLVGRSGMPPRESDPERWQELDAIKALGAETRVVRADVADETAMREIVEQSASDGLPIRGIVHAAAVVEPVPLAQMTTEQLGKALHAKCRGARVLDRATTGTELDFFVLFSSTTALLGASGLAHYAAANLFLDAFAQDRRARGLPAIAVDWGTWEVMRGLSEKEKELLERGGLRPMSVESALDALARLIPSDMAQFVVADVDWARLKALYEARRNRPLLSALEVATTELTANESGSGRASQHPDFDELDDDARRECVATQVTQVVAAVLKCDTGRLADTREGFFDLGMDSLMAVELKSGLERQFSCSLPSTLAFNYPNIDAVIELLLENQFGRNDGRHQAVPEAATPTASMSASSHRANASEEALEAELARRLEGLGLS